MTALNKTCTFSQLTNQSLDQVVPLFIDDLESMKLDFLEVYPEIIVVAAYFYSYVQLFVFAILWTCGVRSLPRQLAPGHLPLGQLRPYRKLPDRTTAPLQVVA